MKTKSSNVWGPRSVSYWLTALAALGIIFLGLRFMLAPTAGAEGFGIPLAPTKEAMAYGRIKGIRDLFSGLVVLLFLLPRRPQATAFAFGAAIIFPVLSYCPSGQWRARCDAFIDSWNYGCLYADHNFPFSPSSTQKRDIETWKWSLNRVFTNFHQTKR